MFSVVIGWLLLISWVATGLPSRKVLLIHSALEETLSISSSFTMIRICWPYLVKKKNMFLKTPSFHCDVLPTYAGSLPSPQLSSPSLFLFLLYPSYFTSSMGPIAAREWIPFLLCPFISVEHDTSSNRLEDGFDCSHADTDLGRVWTLWVLNIVHKKHFGVLCLLRA